MAREPPLAFFTGIFRQLAERDRRADDFRARGSQHDKAGRHRAAQIQSFHGVTELAAGQRFEIGAFLICQWHHTVSGLRKRRHDCCV